MFLLSILFYIFIVVGTIHLIHFALFLIGANFYDIQTFHKNLNRKKSTKKPKQPMVSVLIPAYNEAKVIERSLKSVWNNSYSDIEIVVISDGSTDNTAAVVQKFMDSRIKAYRGIKPKAKRTKHTARRTWKFGNQTFKRRIELIEQRNTGKAGALNHGLTQAHGELIMTLDADSLLHKKAIANVIKYFDDPKVAGVAANVRIIEKHSVLGVLQRFEHMVGYRSKKFFTVINSELIVGGVASTYRRSVLKRVKNYDTDTVTEDIGLSMKIAAMGNKKYRLVYAYDVAAATEGVDNFSALLTQRYRWKLGNLQNLFKYRKMLFSRDPKYSIGLSWYRMPMSFVGELLLLLEPLSLAYVAYLSIRFFTPALILGAYMSISLYLLMIIWPDEHLSIKGKVKASLYAPFLYFIFYIMNFVQLVSIVRCLKDHEKVTNLSKGHSTWVSPKRVGGVASVS